MSRRTSRQRQQSMNQHRRDRWMRLYDLGVPVWHMGALFIPPDPAIEREEFVRQLTARVHLPPDEPDAEAYLKRLHRGEVGQFLGIRIIHRAAEVDVILAADTAKGCGTITIS